MGRAREGGSTLSTTSFADEPTSTKARWGGRQLADGTRLYWWREFLGVYLFYNIYSWSRGRATGSATRAWDNAQTIIDWERALGIYHELTIQQLVMSVRPLIIGLNYFYGIFHFVVTIAVIVYLYRRCTNDYPFWRNVFAFLVGIALVGYIFFPLMPPRLLDTYPLNWDLQFHFKDALAVLPNAWSFTTGPVKHVGNPYAAMPSLHFGWSLYCAVAIYPHVKSRWMKNLAIAYPCVMLLAIVATGNHFILDAVGGALALGIAYLLAKKVTRAGNVPNRTPKVALRTATT